MNDTLDKISKLMELALADDHEGSPAREEERRSAALMACRLISKYKIPVGDIIPEKPLEYTAPSADFYESIRDIFTEKKSRDGRSSDNPDGSPMDAGPGIVIVDRELDDENPIRRQIILAWRAIRESRKKLEEEWRRMNIRRNGHDDGWRG